MQIGERIRALRERESLSQGDLEERTGLLRCYISRVENGHTVPSLDTLERLAAALEMPLYKLFLESEADSQLSRSTRGGKTATERSLQSEADSQIRFLEKVGHLLGRIEPKDRKVLLYVAEKLTKGWAGR